MSTQDETAAAGQGGPATSAGSKGPGVNALAWAVAVMSLALVASVIIATLILRPDVDAEASLVNEDAYQSVFLTNGQVYFGKLAAVDDTYYRLTDIFYLQVQQEVQPSSAPEAGQTTPTTAPAGANAETQLVKLGEELHGPEDSMQINRSQVQFWENLKPDGKVAEAIATYNER